MVRKIGIAFAVLALLVVVLFFVLTQGPDLSQYEPLKNPRLTTMKDQKMVVVEAKGDPNVVGSSAFGLLFKTYYKIDGVAKGPNQPAPRARWSGDMNNKATWVGRYALPVPEQISSLSAIDAEPGLKVELLTWEYGPVAEILHVGPYAAEKPTIEKLLKFIEDSGHVIVGYHEEEYIKGPGMFFKGNPESYYTIIRYRVEKAGGK